PGVVLLLLRGGVIEQMPEQRANGRARDPARQHADDSAEYFARPSHHRCYSTKLPRPLRLDRHNLKSMTTPTVHRTALRGLKKINEGKVRDLYEVDAQTMLIVTTDRLSA